MDDITWFEPGWNHENLCFGSGRYFAYCCQILQRDGNHAMGFRFCSWWDEIALVIYPSTCVLGNKTWPHKFHTSLMVMRTQSPNHCHDSTAFDSRMPCNSSPFSTVLSGRSWLVPSELQAASTRHESSGVSVAGFANLKIVDVDILQQLRFVPMDIENWSSIVVICYVRQGVSSQDSCFAFTFFFAWTPQNHPKDRHGKKNAGCNKGPIWRLSLWPFAPVPKALSTWTWWVKGWRGKIAVIPVKNPQD